MIEESYKELFEVIAAVQEWIAATQHDNSITYTHKCQLLLNSDEFQHLEQICQSELLPSDFVGRGLELKEALLHLHEVSVELAVEQTCTDQLSELVVLAERNCSGTYAAMGAMHYSTTSCLRPNGGCWLATFVCWLSPFL